MYIMINAQILKNALLRAAQSINAHRDEVDGINYFPVPDGDTGTNLAMTLSSCAEAIADCETALASLPTRLPPSCLWARGEIRESYFR